MAILREIALNADGDLLFEGGNLVILEGGAALAQRLSVRLKSHAAEWVFDQNLGTPWIGPIIGAKPNLGIVRSILTARILGTQGVERILSMNLSFDSQIRALTITARVQPESEDEAVEFTTDLEGF